MYKISDSDKILFKNIWNAYSAEETEKNMN